MIPIILGLAVHGAMLVTSLPVLIERSSKGLRASAPRPVRVKGGAWVNASSNETIQLKGPNVVVKGSPWLPRVDGNTVCNDTKNTTCYTFNAADATHITQTMGWNMIRLGVPWPGGQPEDADSLDPTFVANLQAILRLCEEHGIHVVLDMHGDMVGSANCGWGVPMWFSQKAAPGLLGKPLVTAEPFALLAPFDGMFKINSPCGSNATLWSQHAGDPNYNLLNQCCVGLNSGPNNNALGFSSLAQATMSYLLEAGPGRDALVRYWTLLAEAVADYPAAVGMEIMNEPMSIARRNYYETWQAVGEAVVAVIPDISVGVMDLGEGAVLPWWFEKVAGNIDISEKTVAWLTASDNLFYAWHWYGEPKSVADAVKSVTEYHAKWGIASMLTETMSCGAIKAADAVNMSWSYWHYSRYCDTAPEFGGKLPPDSFGACILGWDGANSSKAC